MGDKINNFKSNLSLLLDKANRLFNNEQEFEHVKRIVANIESEISVDKNFYSPENKRVRELKAIKLMESIDTSNNEIYEFIKYEFNSPFGLFYILLDEDVPDLNISKNLVKIQLSTVEFETVYINRNSTDAFSYFLEHFVNNMKFIDSKKLDAANAIIDSNFGIFRFNIVHKSINSHGSSILTVRKHVQGRKETKDTNLTDEEYEKSLGVSQGVIDIIKEYSGKSICVFGEPGSGKTTMLRYVSNYKIEEKRNLCVIEDTPELGIDTNISLVTNQNNTIKDLFTATLRQNPSHLAIGETRTDEIVDIMEAGLTFSVSTTIHAKSFMKAVERIYFMSRPRGLEKRDIHDLIGASIDMFIYMDKRKVEEVWVNNYRAEEDVRNRFDLVLDEGE